MNINTDNFRKQLNSCSRTQDKVAKDSINKGKKENIEEVKMYFHNE